MSRQKAREQGYRPVLVLPLSLLDVGLEVAAGIGLLLLLWLILWAWPTLPDRVPTHFGPSGLPNAWGPKSSLWLLPIFGSVLFAVITVVERFPHTFNFPWKITEENAPRQYRLARLLLEVLKTELVWVFVYIEAVSIRISRAHGHAAGGLSGWFLVVFLVVDLATLAGYFLAAAQAR